jgi:metal-sulfur cluster biosynthetic enzyme
MPDFRVTMTIGAVRSGVAASSVLPTAEAAASDLTLVEAADLAIVAGAARVTIRFEADDAELANQIADHVVAVTDGAAVVEQYRVTVRVKGRWSAAR